MKSLVEHGLSIKILRIDYLEDDPGNRLLAAIIDADDEQLARPHRNRPFALHISIAYENQLGEEHLTAIENLNRKWSGVEHKLWIWWIGSGATAQIHPCDTFTSDPDFVVLFKRKHPHISM
jgi:hypothetical protein